MLTKHFATALRLRCRCQNVQLPLRLLPLVPIEGASRSTLPQQQRRNGSSYFRSRTPESPDKYTKFDKSFAEWKYVERLIPPTHVPTPPNDLGKEFPSGWRVPDIPTNCPYLVRRTKNHQLPVYERIYYQGEVRRTHIRRVEGNIWQLEKDIGNYLQDLFPKKIIVMRTHEVQRVVIIEGGEYVDPVKEWLIAKGF